MMWPRDPESLEVDRFEGRLLSAQIYDGQLRRVRGTVLLLHEHKTRPLPAGRERGRVQWRVEGQDRNPRFFQIAHKDFGKMLQVADSPVCGGDQLSLLEALRSLLLSISTSHQVGRRCGVWSRGGPGGVEGGGGSGWGDWGARPAADTLRLKS